MTAERRTVASWRAERDVINAILLAVAAGGLYMLTGPDDSGGDAFLPLADAFLHGRLLIEARPWLELVPLSEGWAVPFPPAPALTYLPVVAIMGSRPWSTELGVGVMPALLGGASVAMVYVLLRVRLLLDLGPALWLTVAFATTTWWWVAGMGGTHHYAQVCAVFFLLIALLLALGQRWPIAAGLCFALAVGSRLPTGLALPVFLYLYRDRWRWAWFLAGAAPVAAALATYNVARFGSPFDFGYARIPSGASGVVTDEPWYRNGLENPIYIPRGLWAMLMAGPSIDWTNPPYIRPNILGTSLLLTGPFLLWAFAARGRLAAWCGIGAAGIILVDLMHGNPGFAQFGYRFILDAVPLLLVLIGLAVRAGVSLPFRAAVLAGTAFSAYGIIVINLLGYA